MSTERIDSGNSIIGHSDSNNQTTERITDSSTVSSTLVQSASAVNQYHLNGKTYQVEKQIASSGEAEVFLVNEGNQSYALKYYFSNYKPKDEVIAKLQQMKRQDIIYPLDYGVYQDRFWEINEYMEGGTLNERMPLRDIEHIKDLVDRLAEAIHACHQNRIIHRDIKPVNIFFRYKDSREIVLGDFGIASPLTDQSDYRITTVNKTTTYAAPELFTNINNKSTIDNSVDYYALGISLLELWLGEDPFKGISQYNIMRIKSEGKIRIPQDINDKLESLIKGLLTTEPPRRWGYEEIRKWLRGEPVSVHYHTREVKFPPYEFDAMQGIVVTQPADLAFYMDQNRKKAERQLYSGTILNWIKAGSEDLYSEIKEIIEVSYVGNTQENKDAGITKTIYLLDKDRPYRAYDGTDIPDPKDIGKHFENNAGHYLQELTNPAASFYLFLEARGYENRADKYRKYFSQFPVQKALTLLILDLQDNKLLFRGFEFENIKQISSPPDAIRNEVIDAIKDPHSKISVWLEITHPQLSGNLTNWRKLGQYNLQTLRYALNSNGWIFEGVEARSSAEMFDLIRTKMDQFLHSAEASQYQMDADYWLSNYQQSSLASVFSQILQKESISFSDYETMYAQIFKTPLRVQPYSETLALAESARKAVSGNKDHLRKLVNINKNAFSTQLQNEVPLKVFGIEALKDMLEVIADLKTRYPEQAGELMLSLNEDIAALIHKDFNNIQHNSDTFYKYQAYLKKLAEEYLEKIQPQLPYLLHWKRQMEVIQKESANINAAMDAGLKKDRKDLEKKYGDFVKTTLSQKINFLDKGKSFYILYATFIAWILALLLFQRAISNISMFWGSALGAIVLLWLWRMNTRRVKYRSPNRGWGTITDPLHKLIGRMLYKPIYVRLKEDPNNAFAAETDSKKQEALENLEAQYAGKKVNDIFEASVKIMMSNPGSLN